MKEIENFIDHACPVIVNYIDCEGTGHYAIVIGYTNENLIFNDPWHGKGYQYPKKAFQSRWHNQRKTSFGWLMVITPPLASDERSRALRTATYARSVALTPVRFLPSQKTKKLIRR